MKPINEFAKRFNTTLSLDEDFMVLERNRYYLVNPTLKRLAKREFFSTGTCLGKMKGKVFFPSFSLLNMIAQQKDANKITVDAKAEWLFICGRDIFKRGILSVAGQKKKGSHTLVLNRQGECLGFGRITGDVSISKEKVIVKNILDLGDFLRRERRIHR